MAGKQREISVSEFFVKNRHLLGFDNPSKALLTTIKEAVDNSLDACEEAGILPELTVEVHDLALEAMRKDHELTKGEGRFLVVVQDNGPGIVKAQVPKIFGKLLYGSKFHRLRQQRGQQGIGISAAAMYGQLTTGKPIRVTSRVGKRKAAHVFDIQLDTRKNEPVVTHDEELADWHQEHGTRVELEIVANWQQGQRFVNRYVEHTALANPHATLHYLRPVGVGQRTSGSGPGNETLTFPRATNQLPKETAGDQAAPARRRAGRADADGHRVEEPRREGVPADRVQPRVERRRGRHPVAGAVGQEDGPPAGAGREPPDGRRAAQGHRGHPAHEPAHQRPLPHRRRADAQGAGQLPERHRERGRFRRGRAARPRRGADEGGQADEEGDPREAKRAKVEKKRAEEDAVAPASIPDAPPEEGVEKIKGHNYFIATVTRPPKVYRGNPFQIEVGLAYGGSWPADKTIELFRFANRVPLLFQRGACGITDAIVRTDWRNYQLSQPKGSLPVGPMALLVHIASVWVPSPASPRKPSPTIPTSRRRSSSRPRSAGASSRPSSASARRPTTRPSAAASSSCTSRRWRRPSARSRARSPNPIKREFLKVAHQVTAAEMEGEEVKA